MSDKYFETYVPGRSNKVEKKTYKKPEGDVAKKIDDYLALLGMINDRTNSGHWETVEGHHIQGAKKGTQDKTCCTPHGRYLAIETKAPKKGQSPAQKERQALVESKGGTYILARSVDDLRHGLVAAYGASRVEAWEREGKARQAAKKAEIDALKRKMGQL